MVCSVQRSITHKLTVVLLDPGIVAPDVKGCRWPGACVTALRDLLTENYYYHFREEVSDNPNTRSKFTRSNSTTHVIQHVNWPPLHLRKCSLQNPVYVYTWELFSFNPSFKKIMLVDSEVVYWCAHHNHRRRSYVPLILFALTTKEGQAHVNKLNLRYIFITKYYSQGLNFDLI